MSPRWAILLSGRGSTAQAVMDLIPAVNVTLVVSSRASAPGVLRARRLGIPVLILAKEVDWADLDRQLRVRQIQRVFLLGFMKILPSDFVASWQGRIWNVHPSLLPAYPGAKALERALADRAEIGISLHDVIAEMDAGMLRRQVRVCAAQDFDAIEFSQYEQRLVRDWAERQSFSGAFDFAQLAEASA